MPTPTNYIHRNAALSAEGVWNQYCKQLLTDGDYPCPWVVLGNLYTSITITGNTSWDWLARDLYRHGERKFAVLTGRHGDQLGSQLVDGSSRIAYRTTNKEDAAIQPELDAKTALVLLRDLRFPGIQIAVEDVNNDRTNTVAGLKERIKYYLQDGRVVILAWCYSLYAMRPGWYGPKEKLTKQFITANEEPVFRVYFDEWEWLWKLYPGSDASTYAEGLARKF